jgi:hypothetical protein
MNATCSTKTIVRFQKRAQWGDATGFAWRCDAAGVTTINPYLIEWIERAVHFCGREKKPQQKTSSPMRFLLATSILASILISSSIAAEAGPMETAPPPEFTFNRGREILIRVPQRTGPNKKAFEIRCEADEGGQSAG